MIDTVHFNSAWRVIQDHPDWELREDKVTSATGDVLEGGYLRLKHRHLNIRASGSAATRILKNFKIPSLGTLLHGHNGIPLNGQGEIEAAFDVLDRLLSQVAQPVDSKPTRRFNRVDISLNLLGFPYERIEPVLQRTNLPQSRMAVRQYRGESLTFYRGETELQIYNKTVQSESKRLLNAEDHPHVARIELRLSNDDLERELKSRPGRGVQTLEILDCYRALRRHVVSLNFGREGEVIKIPERIEDLPSFLAYLGTRQPELLDHYLLTLKPDYRRQLKRKIASIAPSIAEVPIDWDRILPVDHPPAQTQIVVPGMLPDYLRPIVEDVLQSRGMGRGAHLLHDRHLNDE